MASKLNYITIDLILLTTLCMCSCTKYNYVDGGTAMIGISKPVIKAHGSSNGHAIACAIRQAAVMARTGVAQTIEETLKTMPQADE